MRLRLAQGDRIGALRAYSRCRTVLAEELQVEPEPETVALAKQMRQTAPLRPLRAWPPQASPGQSPAHPLDDPFLGRTAEFGTLIESYQRARAGQPQLVLLQGASGIGKTRLSTEFVRWAQAQGADVLAGRALQTGSELAYQPLMDVLRRRLEQGHAPDDLGSPVWLAELARLLPELRDRYPDLPVPSTDEALGHNRLFEAIARLLQMWAARRLLVLLLDDMQWADTATLDLLIYLACRLTEQPAPLLLLLTVNPGAACCTEAQSTWVMALKRTRLPLTQLLLAPFTKEEVRRFVQELAWAEQPFEMDCPSSTGRCPVSGEACAGREALLSFTDWLYRHTSGQPLYLMETLKGLMARGIMFPSLQESGAWGLVLRPEMLAQTPVGELIPQILRELIRAQLARLSPSAWTLLVTASALEEGLSFERLCQVAGLDELEELLALEELLRGGWLSEGTVLAESSLLDGYAFPRQIISEVMCQETGATRRWVVQRRLAAIIRAGIAHDQGEDARSPHATPAEKHARQGEEQDRDGRSWWGRSAVALGAFGGPKRKKTMRDAQHIQQQSTHLEQRVPDGALVKLALAGDQSSFDALVHRYRTMLASYIGSFFRDSELVFDVLQHVFLQLYLTLPVLLTNVSLHAWLFQVAHNRCLDELRHMRRHAAVPFSTLEWEDGEEEQSMVSAIPDPDPLPEEVVETSDQYGTLHEAIAALPPKLRSIVFLHCFRHLTFTEIGQRLHLPPSTVKTYFYRSLPYLRRALAADTHFASVS